MAVALAWGVGSLPAPAAGPKRPATAPVDMSASDVGAALTRMLLDKPGVPVTPPKGVAPPRDPVPVPVEGSMIVNRLCSLRRDEKTGWAILAFEPQAPQEQEVLRWALPSQLLEQMEVLAARWPDAQFRVSGETTVYGGRGYLLMMKATVLPASPKAPQPAPAVQLGPRPLVQPVPRQPTSRPAASTRPAGKEPTSDDILSELLQEKVGRPVRVPAAASRPAAAPSVAPGAGETLEAGSGAMVVDRLVRVLPERTGSWWQARFEADNTLQEPPMRLLPCGFLARAQRMQAGRQPGALLVLRVSGLITQYRQRRYLLLRKLMPERRLDRF